MSQFTIRFRAEPGHWFAADAFDGQVGKETTVAYGPHRYPARLVRAVVVSREEALLTLDADLPSMGLLPPPDKMTLE